jgi:hypothetical protein
VLEDFRRVFNKSEEKLSCILILKSLVSVLTMMFGSLLSPPWPIWAPIFAAAGGVVVILGLCMEHFGTPVEERRKLGGPVRWGWRILIVGLGIEVITAFALTVHAEHENQANDPMKQNISDIVGFVYFEVKGTNVDVPVDRMNSFSRGCGEAYLATTNIIGGMLPFLTADTFMRGRSQNADDGRSYYLRLQATAMSAMWMGSPNNAMKVEEVNRHKFLYMTFPFLTNNAEILNGGAEIIVNGNVRYSFKIPAQSLARQFADSPDSSPRWVLATNFMEKIAK